MSTRFRPHSQKQEQIIFSDAPLTIAGTGTQWGKSQSAALWLKRMIHRFTDPTDNFLILAPSYKIMNQSAIPYFKHYMEGLGDYNKADGEFRLDSGGVVYLRTGTDPDSIVGIPKVRAYWLDEAGKASLYFWENIQARAAAVGAHGLLTTSPYSLNWLYRDYIKPIQDGKIRDVPLVQAASWENPYHTLHNETAREAMKRKMDPRRFLMIFGGQWGRMQGLVYDCWDDAENLIDAFELPSQTRFVAGVDWGHTHPFVIKVRGITPEGRHYGVSEFYKTGLTITGMIQAAKAKLSVYGIKMFYCDPSRPENILEFNRNGIPAVGANNDIRIGIDHHYELIKTRQYKEFLGACPHSADERETYHYPEPEDLKPDEDAKDELPVDQNNHCMDADRYITIETYRHSSKSVPKAPEESKNSIETLSERIARLKKKRAGSRQSENWS